jgi:hypothetical protein
MSRSDTDDISQCHKILEHISTLKTLVDNQDYDQVRHIVSELSCLRSKLQQDHLHIDPHDLSNLISTRHEVTNLIQSLIQHQADITSDRIMIKKNQHRITTYIKNQT